MRTAGSGYTSLLSPKNLSATRCSAWSLPSAVPATNQTYSRAAMWVCELPICVGNRPSLPSITPSNRPPQCLLPARSSHSQHEQDQAKPVARRRSSLCELRAICSGGEIAVCSQAGAEVDSTQIAEPGWCTSDVRCAAAGGYFVLAYWRFRTVVGEDFSGPTRSRTLIPE